MSDVAIPFDLSSLPMASNSGGIDDDGSDWKLNIAEREDPNANNAFEHDLVDAMTEFDRRVQNGEFDFADDPDQQGYETVGGKRKRDPRDDIEARPNSTDGIHNDDESSDSDSDVDDSDHASQASPSSDDELERARRTLELMHMDTDTPSSTLKEFYTTNRSLHVVTMESKGLIGVYENLISEDWKLKVGLTWEEHIQSVQENRKLICNGDVRVREFMQYVTRAKMIKFGPQMEVVRGALGSLMRQFFGNDYAIHRERVLKEYGVTDDRGQLLVTMARRNGKTQIAAVIEAACQRVMGGVTAIFAAVLQQASDLMELIHARVLEFSEGLRNVVKVKNSRKVVYDFSDGRNTIPRGILRCFSGSAKSARGFKADRIYFDEASFASREFITKNVFAGMYLGNTFVMMISSPPTDSNHIFAQMCNATDDVTGDRLFKYVRIDTMCAACRDKKALSCPHIRAPKAAWLAGESEMEIIYKVLGKLDPLALRQEIFGMIVDDDVSCFSEQSIKDFKSLPAVSFEQPPQYILVGVDTSGGGKSETAICAMAMDGDVQGTARNHVIMGLETFSQSNSIEEEAQIVSFLDRLITQKHISRRSEIIFFVESNCGGSSRAAAMYTNIRAWGENRGVILHAVSDDATTHNRAGFWLTPAKKEQMAIYTRKLLDEHKLRIHTPLCTRMENPILTLSQQMANYKRVSRPETAKSHYSQDSHVPFSYTGKAGGQVDDLCVILQECALLLPIMLSGHQKKFMYIPPAHITSEMVQIRGRDGSVKFITNVFQKGTRPIAAPTVSDEEMVDVATIEDDHPAARNDFHFGVARNVAIAASA